MSSSGPAPKAFQRETAKVVVRALERKRGARRFLIADEVGLGKTIVAREVVRRLIEKSDRPLIVFYVCSNLAIARQNRDQLLKLLPTAEERESAVCGVDRLTLLPVGRAADHPELRLYTLTPDTSIPTRRGQRRDGTKQERALIHHLVSHFWPGFFTERGERFFQRTATATWDEELENRKQVAADGRLRELFRRAVRTELELERGMWVPTALRKLSDLDVIVRLRNALAVGALESVRPDLVIFDEFQRFRDLLRDDQDESASRVIRVVRGDEDAEARLLLLSATPYRLYAQNWEAAEGNGYGEFEELVSFLYGGNKKGRAKLEHLRLHLGCLKRHALAGSIGTDDADACRASLRRLLKPVMARTERLSNPTAEWSRDSCTTEAPLAGEDLEVFRHLAKSLAAPHRSAAVSLWSSMPYPMQIMGADYTVWKDSDPAPARAVPRLTRRARNHFEPPETPAHPRFRALLERLDSDTCSLPWVAPTLPWWGLSGPWEQSAGAKALLFSRYRATPRAIASLASYLVETAHLEGGDLSYMDVSRRRLLSASQDRHGLPWLFHPSPFLIESTDPLAGLGESRSEVRAIIRTQLRKALAELGVQVDEGSDRRLSLWQLGPKLEKRSGHWEHSLWSWRQVERDQRSTQSEDAGGALGRTLERWNEEATVPLEWVSGRELAALTEVAVGGPGVVVGRSLRRHWPDAVSSGLEDSIAASWVGLRNYLDQRWFASLLRSDGDGYPEAILGAVFDGNLESVLDEHLWITGKLRGLEGRALSGELLDGLTVKTSSVVWHSAHKKSEEMRLRCHTAMPFGDARQFTTRGKSEGRSIRADELRKAFNTPFFPHLLASTSVGQEGLDFHTWCSTVVHWDLPSNPVDLEQREGRVSRYGGLSIRRAIAAKLNGEFHSSFRREGSPWRHLESLAENRLSDRSGLQPWWICDGAGIERLILVVPTSEQLAHWHRLQKERLLYRLVLGQPNQEDLVEVLAGKLKEEDIDPDSLRGQWISLSPWFDRASEASSR